MNATPATPAPAASPALPSIPPPFPPPFPAPAPAPAAEPEWTEHDGLAARLLKSPVRFVSALRDGETPPRLLSSLLFLAVSGHALFGLAAGFFDGPLAAALGVAKGACVAVASFLLCLPALFVFSWASGAALSARRIAELGASCTATAGLLLAALAPVEWLFAVSTANAAFVVLLSVAGMGAAAWFASRPASAATRAGIVRTPAGLRAWLAVLVLVSFQSLTLLRPILSAPKASAGSRQKMFFVEHFFRSFDGR